ncbi:hypothetical protein TSUD_289380 [Trifolium subterraneum]|uniref:PORR domain-containing protein n=1 Tax=Trifolium subterraneum TaxID=3900 RepID=A0A2Z6M9V5_TRISU|nr:hypothetical protein TSUD_289380 [Trifolium subterraneum]
MRFTAFFHRTTTTLPPPSHRQHLRTLFDGNFTLVRDRGLDHAVEREKNLKPLLNLRNLIKQEPSKSLPVSIIKESIQLPFRPMDFIRKYPSVFEEFYSNGKFDAHVRLTPEAVELDEDEGFMFKSELFKKQVADRLLKLLMISKIHKIPLRVLEGLRWDLGLPMDYVKTIIPEFPDYFRVIGMGDNAVLELVCWCKEQAVSVLEKKLGDKGKELAFPLQFSTGFEMDNKYEKWLKDWNKLPYVSPYENAGHLNASSDESDRWVVGVLHEIMNLLVSKKTEKDNVLMLGEWLGLASRFKRAILQHPGIFYLSSKNRTYTVVLREGYKRGFLIEDNPAMEFRRKYIHLMNTVKEDNKTDQDKVVKDKTSTKESKVKADEGKVGEGEREENHGEEKEEGEETELSDAEDEDASETIVDDDNEESARDTRRTSSNRRRRNFAEMKLNTEKPSRNFRRERSAEKLPRKTWEKNPSQVSNSKNIQMRGEHNDVKSSPQGSRSSKNRERLFTTKNTVV